MSTRRARIKAVTSLPPRRKNAAAVESKVKDPPEKITRSPRVPIEEKKSPRIKNGFESTAEIIAHNSVVETHIISEKLSTTNVNTTRESPLKLNTSSASITPDKLHVNSTDVKNHSTNIFISPARRDSTKKTFASPVAPSPKINKNIDLQKPSTPLRSTPTAQKISENSELQIAERVISKISHNVKSKKDHAKDDYNIPSVPESIGDEAMDGIVPLKPAASAPKPIHVLKNEIISENAEVLFDPIIPLPSPSKVRPKLRPVPRLCPIRRNSVQGSASESEDENRRGLLNSKERLTTHDIHTLQSLPNRDVSRVRNDSVCSSVSQVATQPAGSASPVKEKQIHKTRRQEEARRRMAMRRRKENAKRDTLTMYDLIFYNPTSNPLVLNEDELKLKEAKEKDEADRIAQEKEAASKPESPKKPEKAAPVPQIKLGPKGEIILDEQSLRTSKTSVRHWKKNTTHMLDSSDDSDSSSVIKQTESDRQVSSVVHEGSWGPGAEYKKYNLYRSAGWTAQETVRFYRALAALGTDFTLMAQLFPDRTRKQLKVKFKKEEKLNGAQIDKALRATLQFDVMQLKKEFEEERELAAKQAELERQRLSREKQAERERLKNAKEVRIRQSRGSKALESTMMVQEAISTEDIIEHSIKNRPYRKRGSKQSPTQNSPVTPQLSTLALVSSSSLPRNTEDACASKVTTPILQIKTPESVNALQIPTNIETGSLVVLTVNDPSSPAKKMLQTYIASGPGKLTPVALPPTFLNCVVGYMKKGTPKGSTVSSPQLLSPSSVTSHDTHHSAPTVSVLPTPAKRQRHSSYTITQL